MSESDDPFSGPHIKSTPAMTDTMGLSERRDLVSRDLVIAAMQAIADDPPSHEPGICVDMAIRAVAELPSAYAKDARIAELSDEAEAFRGKLAEASGKLLLADTRLASQAKLIGEMRDVLRPFAKCADMLGFAGAGNDPTDEIELSGEMLLPHLNAARTLLSKLESQS